MNKELENKGTISGVGSNTSGNGYGIENRSTTEDITNAGLISGTGNSTSDTGTGSGIHNTTTGEYTR